MNYLDLLKRSYQQTGNAVCLGLDPVWDALPESCQSKGVAGIGSYYLELLKKISAEGLIPAAFKPNQGYYLRFDRPFQNDFSGSQALAETIMIIRDYFPGIPIILDSKRGDIATSSANYADEAFTVWQCDAVTVSPYMGSDSVIPFLSHGNGGTYILNRTSNPGAADFQDFYSDKSTLYECVADQIIQWNHKFPGTGAVVGATSSKELASIAKKYSDNSVPMLIPGVGSQGGSMREVLNVLDRSGYDPALARINSSSGITHPWAKKKEAAPDDWISVALKALEEMMQPFRRVN